MAPVVIERRFERPQTLEVLARADRDARWCLDAHGCALVVQSMSPDGLRSLCVYDAPDAEAMRRATGQLGVRPPPVIWPATLHAATSPAAPMAPPKPGENTLALVDRSFPAPVEFATVQAMEVARASCLTMHRVRFLRSYFSFDGRRMACIYAAPDLEAVRSAIRATGLPYDSVRPARAATARATIG